MIRLIATDLDGTLLNDKKELPPDFFPILQELNRLNVHFVAASGRSRQALRRVFGEKIDHMTLICDNGAFLVDRGTVLFRSDLTQQNVIAVDAAVQTLGPRVRAILCGTKHTYIRDFSGSQELRDRLAISYPEYQTYRDPREIDDFIFKIAVCDMAGAGEHSYPVLAQKFGEKLRVVWSGPVFLDIMNLGIDKGTALSTFQAQWNISPAETMTFGDFYNDVELLKASKYSFIMANAEAGMAAYGRYRAASNNDCGVTRAIRKYVLQQEAFPAPGTPWIE